jgi:hypothetical protein
MDTYTNSAQLSLPLVRRRLVQQIQQRSAPGLSVLDIRAWQRRCRLVTAQRVLADVRDTRLVAVAVGVTTRAVRYWRAGRHVPTVRHVQQLAAIGWLVRRAAA